MWEPPCTVPAGADDPATLLTGTQRRVLNLMPTNGDEAIARRLNMSLTTVRRQVKAIYAALGVDSRFAAGVAAAKRGLI